MFRGYTHVERFGNSAVMGIEVGECYIFPKLDGTNASIWWDDDLMQIHTGSRTRELSEENDNAGFHKWAKDQQCFYDFFAEYPSMRLFGEWLVPHSLKTYNEDAWRRFYVFDMVYKEIEEGGYHHYNHYNTIMEKFGIDYISPIKIIKNPIYDNLIIELENNKFLIEDGKGSGEGVVIKNYDYENQWGRMCYAKLVTNEFKEKHSKEMGAPQVINKMVEDAIAQKYVTKALCDKVEAKIVNEEGHWESKFIPRILQTVYHDIVVEEIWDILKKMKQPIINFRTLNSCIIMEIKRVKPELF